MLHRKHKAYIIPDNLFAFICIQVISLLYRITTRDYHKLLIVVSSTLVALNTAIYIQRKIHPPYGPSSITYLRDYQNSQSSAPSSLMTEISKPDIKARDTLASSDIPKIKPIVEITKNKTKFQITLAEGDTLYSTLLKANIEKNAAHLIAVSVNKVYKLSQLKVGENLTITFINGDKIRNDIKAKVASMLIQTADKEIKIDFNEQKRAYTATMTKGSGLTGNHMNQTLINKPSNILNISTKNSAGNNSPADLAISSNSRPIQNNLSSALNKKSPIVSEVHTRNATVVPTLVNNSNQYLAAGKISGSFIDSVKRTGVPGVVASEMAKVLGHAIDFQRELTSKSLFKVIYTTSNKILYLHLNTGKKNLDIYQHTLSDGTSQYFHKDGSSVKKALMKTPIKGGVLGSGFGIRHHPVLGYSKMHKGLDYKAKRGAPIIAAGDGVIETVTQHRGYGRYIKIRHNNKYDTLYAHLDRFAKHIKIGTKVKQGEVIGFVGDSGLATGYHLHFELHENGRAINPKKAISFNTDTLSKQQFADFQNKQYKIDSILNKYQAVIVANIESSGKVG